MACAAPLVAPAELGRQARKVITVLFSDVTGFTTISERVDTEALHWVMERYRAGMRVVIERHGGRVERFIGDAVMAVFGLPAAHEDDALRAVRAAVDIREELELVNTSLPSGLDLRLTASTGLNTGEVFISEEALGLGGAGELIADTVNVAARLESRAEPGEVLLGELTYRSARGGIDADRIELELKGKSGRVVAYRLRSLTSAEGPARTLVAPTVGRKQELQVLADAFDDVQSRSLCRLVTVVGEAGAGKSRLVRDAVRALASRAGCFSGRCLPYGEGTVFWPLAEIVCSASGVRADDPPERTIDAIAQLLDGGEDGSRETASRLAGALGLAPLAGAPEEIDRDMLALFDHLASETPVVVVIEDLHWAAQRLLTALSTLVHGLERRPVLLICTARPELRDAHPDWPDDDDGATLVEVPLLGDADCALLVRLLLQDAPAAAQLSDPVGGIARGNPLIVEEVLAMLVDDGALEHDGDGWQLTRTVPDLRIPPTIEAVLAARLDLLSSSARELLEAAAVVGKDFDVGDVCALLRGDEAVVVGQLGGLTDRQMLDQQVGASDYRFHHMLIRDATYAATTKRHRAELHERFADYLEVTAARRKSGTYGEIAGEHLERSCFYRRELGAADRDVAELAHRAGALLEQAGRRARGLSDFPAARRIFTRADDVLLSDDPLRPRLLTGLAETLLDFGLPQEAQAAARTAKALAEQLDAGQETLLRASIARARIEVQCGDGSLEQACSEVRDMVGELERLGDGRAAIWGWMSFCFLRSTALRFDESWPAAARAAALAREHAPGDMPYCLVGMTGALCGSSVPIAEALERCEEALALVRPDTLHGAWIVARGIAPMEAMQGKFDRARSQLSRSNDICKRYGSDLFIVFCEQEWGWCELLAGDFRAAELHFRSAREAGSQLDEQIGAEVMAEGALTLVRLGRYEEALADVRSATRVLTKNDIGASFFCQLAAAHALLRLGDLIAAEQRAREALEIVRDAQSPFAIGEGLACLGEILLAQESRVEARTTLLRAVETLEAKGAIVPARNARELLAESDRGQWPAMRAT